MSDVLEELKATDVPDMVTFRRYVDKRVKRKRNKALIKTLYLTAGRVSEITTRVTDYDLEHGATKPYGKLFTVSVFPKTDVKNKWMEDIALFKLATAKRSKKKIAWKIIALPCNPVFEPWTIDVLHWAVNHDKKISFDLTRFGVWRIVKNCLSKLDPKIHPHSLRHYRLTHLADEYQFDAIELTLYSGWTFAHGTRGSRQLDTYLHLGWSRYLPKLLVPCRYKTALAKKVLETERQKKEQVERDLKREELEFEGVTE